MKTNIARYRTCVCNINYHVVWCVKYRRKVITPQKEQFLKYCTSFRSWGDGSYTLLCIGSAEDGDNRYCEVFEGNYRQKAVRGVSGSEAEAVERTAVEPLLLCGDSWFRV